MTSVARNLRWSSFARWQFPRLGFANNERFEHLLSKILHCRTFEQLRIPLAIVAADIMSGEAVVFREGDLMLPLRASCSFPGLFAPIEYGPRLLVDGMIVGSVPATALTGMDVVVAVHLPTQGLRERPTNFFQVVGECFHIAQRLGESAWRDYSDLVIEPQVENFHWDAFARADALILAGEMAARRALPALRKLLAERAVPRKTKAAAPAGEVSITWPSAPRSSLPAWPARVPTPNH
jgi:NTE family protein